MNIKGEQALSYENFFNFCRISLGQIMSMEIDDPLLLNISKTFANDLFELANVPTNQKISIDLLKNFCSWLCAAKKKMACITKSLNRLRKRFGFISKSNRLQKFWEIPSSTLIILISWIVSEIMLQSLFNFPDNIFPQFFVFFCFCILKLWAFVQYFFQSFSKNKFFWSKYNFLRNDGNMKS